PDRRSVGRRSLARASPADRGPARRSGLPRRRAGIVEEVRSTDRRPEVRVRLRAHLHDSRRSAAVRRRLSTRAPLGRRRVAALLLDRTILLSAARRIAGFAFRALL